MGGSSAAEENKSAGHGGTNGHQLLQSANRQLGDLEQRDAVANCCFLVFRSS